MKTLTTSTILMAVTLVSAPSVAQNQQQPSGTGQFCIKGASGPIKCEYQTLAQCQQALPSGSSDQCLPRSDAGTIGRAPANAPGEQKD